MGHSKLALLLALIVGALLGASGLYLLSQPSGQTQVNVVSTPLEPLAEPNDPLQQRVAITLTQSERNHVRMQMIAFLSGMSTISDATLQGDRETIRETADALSRADGSGQAIGRKAPEGFRQISRGLRQDFADMAEMSINADMAEIQLKQVEVLYRCSACHGSYRVEPAEPE